MLLRKDRPGGHCNGVDLSVIQHSDCIELSLGENDERVESSCVRMKGQTNKGDIAVSICYRMPDWEEEVNMLLNRQLEAASQS